MHSEILRKQLSRLKQGTSTSLEISDMGADKRMMNCGYLTLFRGRGDANLHYPLYFLQHCQSANMHTLEILTFYIYIYGIFWQNFMHVGGCVQNLWPFWEGGLHEE